MSAASAGPDPRGVPNPQATSGTASGSPASRCRGGNQKPNIVGAERRHQQLRSERRGAQAGRELDLAHRRHRPRHALATRVPQPPEAREGQREHRRPAQQPVVAIQEQRHQPVGALEVAARKARVRGGLARDVGRVRRRPAVDRLVDRHVERHREQRQLDRAHRERPVPRPPERARGERSDHDARRHELRAQPRQRAEQQEAQARLPARHPLVQAQRRAAPPPRARPPPTARGRPRCRTPGAAGSARRRAPRRAPTGRAPPAAPAGTPAPSPAPRSPPGTAPPPSRRRSRTPARSAAGSRPRAARSAAPRSRVRAASARRVELVVRAAAYSSRTSTSPSSTSDFAASR